MKNLFTPKGLSGYLKTAALLLTGFLAPATESQAQYCTPSYTSGCTTGNGDYINGFMAYSSNGGSSIYNMGSGCNGNANNYIYNSGMTVDADQGSTFYWFVLNGPNSNQGYMMWADWNQDGDFLDAGENVYSSPSGLNPFDSVSGSITVPPTATPGTTRIRVRSALGSLNFDPCNLEANGETEDYNLNITAVVPCNGTPVAGTASASTSSICMGGVVVLTLQGNTAGQGITIQWNESPAGGSSWTPIVGATGNTYIANVTTSTDFQAVVSCSGGGTFASDISNTVSITVNPAGACQDSVWPGDANYDYTVDNLDPLNIAIAYGQQGTARPMASIGWYGQYSANWGGAYANGLDYKHGDCDGNAVIDSSDLNAVAANYSLTHLKPGSYANLAKVTGLPDLYLDLNGITLTPGSTVDIPVKFGTSGVPASDIYGIAATINIIGFTPASAPIMTYPSGWMGNSSNTLHFTKAVNNNKIDWTFARINHNTANGNGVIGMLKVNIPSDALGQVIFSLDNVTVIDAAGTVITGYNVIDDTSSITTGIGNTPSPVESATVVPNPSNERASLEVYLNKASMIDVKVMDVTGRTVWTNQLHLAQGNQSISLPYQNLSKGLYMIQLNTGNGQTPQLIKWITQ